MKYTQGEWMRYKGNIVTKSTSTLIDYECNICKLNENLDEAEANAKLIAAAPELLEQLKNILWNFEGKEGLSNVQMAAIKYARETVNKATL